MEKLIPILFSSEMVRAILEGRKFQTRRIIKGIPYHDHFGTPIMDWPLSQGPTLIDGEWYIKIQNDVDSWTSQRTKCKYAVGDVLWVRETIREYCYVDEGGTTHFDRQITEYAADNPEPLQLVDGDGFQIFNRDGSEKFVPWKPSIFMPKRACRIWLKITSIRVERLQDISEEDAIAEGVEVVETICGQPYYKMYTSDFGFKLPKAKDSFNFLWQSINGAESWTENPWVWCVQFERTTKPELTLCAFS